MSMFSPVVRCEVEQHGNYQKYEYFVYDVYGIGVIGYGVVYRRNGFAEIRVINVHRGYRGEGIGSLMLQKIVEDHSQETICVKTFDSLVHWYERFGFKVVDPEALLLLRTSAV